MKTTDTIRHVIGQENLLDVLLDIEDTGKLAACKTLRYKMENANTPISLYDASIIVSNLEVEWKIVRKSK